MKSKLYFEILELLESAGISQWGNITSLMNIEYPLEGNYDILTREYQISHYLEILKRNKHIFYDLAYIRDYADQPNNEAKLMVKASLTIYGFEYLSNLKRDKSTLETNETIRKQSKRQTLILIGALSISIFSLIISWLNYNAINDKLVQKQYLLPSKELIEQIKPKPTLMNDLQNLPVKKTLPKRN
jgi:hypothetical protein